MAERPSNTPESPAPALPPDSARRRHLVRVLSGSFVPLTVLAVALILAVDGPAPIAVINGVAAAAFLVTYWMARRANEPSRSAASLLGVMLIQHLATSLVGETTSSIGDSVMFMGLLPLVATVTLGWRGTATVTGIAALSAALVFGISMSRGFTARELGQDVGSALLFVLVGGAVGTLAAFATQRAQAESLRRAGETRHAEASARDAETRLAALADQVSDLVSVVDRRGRHTFASASYERILGVPPEAMLGHTTDALLHPDDQPTVAAAWAEALTMRTNEVVARLRATKGEYRTFHVRLKGVVVDDKPHVAFAARDITDLKNLTAELESARRMDALGRLAGGVAHDFNNLLSVLGTCTSLVSGRLPAEHAAQKELRVMEDAVDRAARLTGQLLSFARRQVLPESRTSPSESLQQLAPLLERAAGQAVEVCVDATDASWVVPLADSQLEQIVMNLVVNARDAMPDGGRIDIRVRNEPLTHAAVAQLPAGEYVCIEVQDTGCGMSTEVQGRIFEPFFTTKDHEKGTGLGLATSFGIAHQAGGNLSVESRVGHGATFRLRLPRATTTAVPDAPVVTLRDASGPALRVLVVDDEPAICDVVAELARSEGMEVTTAGAVDEAFARAEESVFDAILTDVVLGSDDGLTALQRLRTLHPKANLVVMSGYAPAPERLNALAARGIGFLSKPFSKASLLQALRRRPA